jgi:hypothetical protein
MVVNCGGGVMGFCPLSFWLAEKEEKRGGEGLGEEER